MSDIAVRVDGLSKQYRIGGKQEEYRTLREALTQAFVSPFRRAHRLLSGQAYGAAELDETIWALREVSFEIKQGEVVGIIGPNGAGKTTVLKILSRITEPTEGYAEIHGRVGSLLEVGTGFHPELTGRENVYLNGSILGMKKRDIDRKFEEIVEFAEIEKFINTPVKHYSSGMYVRLAFSVAAHLEPEILLVDEVLAVGDAAFQKKCLGKMGDVTKEGRTVLFVSHNMVAIQNLCKSVIWLHEGRLIENGQPSQIVSEYLQASFSALTEQIWDDIDKAPGNDYIRIHRVSVRPNDGSPSDPIYMQASLEIEIEFWNLIPGNRIDIALHFFSQEGIISFGTGTLEEPLWHGKPFSRGRFRSTCHVPGNLLNSGTYRIEVIFDKDQGTVLYRHEDILIFEVVDSLVREGWFNKLPGVVRPKLVWKTEQVNQHEHRDFKNE